ncbi:hypothetical protein C8R48DRAFT_768742 [Suillus tomentosus]|nr:hypothetical protein C8R48DRAFT_768742 [Suillus tomentosus]
MSLSRRGRAETYRNGIIPALQPLVVKGSLFTSAANRIQTGIAIIIVLEYSASLLNELKSWEIVESAVNYYLKSLTAAAVEKGAKEICRQGYRREELRKKVLEFILENRLCPQIPAHLLPTVASAGDSDEDNDYTPDLPPDLTTSRAAGPLTPSKSESNTPPPNRHYVGPSLPHSQTPYDDDSDSDVGPQHFLALIHCKV